jgi:hypothetical protein
VFTRTLHDLGDLVANWQSDPINWDDYPTLALFVPSETEVGA